MSIIVKKFGGTSVGGIERIQFVAQKIAEQKKDDESIVIVVSAMAKKTDELIAMAYQISKHPSNRELDMLVTAGERVSMSLLSLALQERGINSISFTGSQSGIITDSVHGNANIKRVNAFRIREELEKGKVVIVAGFQGVSEQKEITTLGRGGSDTSAVALASYLQAKVCEIYTDVDGVYTADPRIVDATNKLKSISYEKMLYLANSGSKVLHPRALEFALKYNIPVEVKSSFSFIEGTMIDKHESMESSEVKAIAHKNPLVVYELPAHTIDKLRICLNHIETELFTYSVTDEIMRIYIEAKYETDFLHTLEQQSIKPILKFKECGSVTITGLRITQSKDFFIMMLKDFADNGYQMLEMKNEGLGISFIVPNEQVNALVNFLHNKYIKG